MNKNLDQNLQSHFSQKQDVPAETKLALRAKLHNSLQRPEKLHFIWLLVLCTVLSAAAVLFAVEMLFGMSVAIVLGVGFYIVATLAGVAVLISMLVAKKFQTSSI